MFIFMGGWGYILLVEWLVGLVDNWLFEGGNHKWESWMVIEGKRAKQASSIVGWLVGDER